MPGEIPLTKADDNAAEKNIVEISENELNALAEAKFMEFVNDENANPFLLIQKKIEQLNKQVVEYEQECVNLTKFCENIVQNQEKYLRKNGVLPRIPTRTVGVNVNITYVAESSASSSLPKQSDPVLNTDISTNNLLTASDKTQVCVKPLPTNICSSQGNDIKQPQTSHNSSQILSKTVSSSASSEKGSDKSVDFIDLTEEEHSAKLQNSHGSVPSKAPLSSGIRAVQNKALGEQVVRNVENATGHPTNTSDTVSSMSFSRPFSSATSFRIPAHPSTVSVQQNTQGQKIAYVSPQTRSSTVEPRLNFHSNRVGDAHSQYITSQRLSTLPAVVIPSRPRILSAGVRPRSNIQVVSTPGFVTRAVQRHPAPVPVQPSYSRGALLEPPPKPRLEIRAVNKSITLQWNLNLNDTHANIANYQLYGYEETNGPIDSSLWKKVGDIKALPLPMACTLTQFGEKKRYHFTVRGVDIHSRPGPFSEPVTVFLKSVSG